MVEAIKHRSGFLRKIFSQDHKVIGLQYLFTAIFMSLVAGGLAMLIRLNLAWPEHPWPILGKFFNYGFEDGVMKPEFYLSLVTLHGTLMVFFVVSLVWSGFGNYLIPLMIGAEDMAFPFLNMLSYWTVLPGCILMIFSLFIPGGAAQSGWTAYPPLSAVTQASPGSGLGQDLWLAGMVFFIVSFTMGGLNFITTILQMRVKGMTMLRLPILIWIFLLVNVLGLLTFPALTAAAVLLIADRHLGTSFFLPSGLYMAGAVLHHQGGTPLLWEHLFWFLGHPEVYVVGLPAIGVAFEIFSVFTRKPPFGYLITILSSIAVCGLSMMVWGHHMFVSGLNPAVGEFFSFATLLIAIPFSIIGLNLLAGLWGGKMNLTPPMLFSLGVLSMVGIGGFTGLFLADAVADIPLHNTYFVVGHFHFVIAGLTLFGIFAALYYWYPKMFGRKMNEKLGKVHFFLTIIAFYCTFIPMFYLGFGGMMRHLYDPAQYNFLKPLQPINVFVSISAFILGSSQIIFLYNFFYCLIKGEKAEANPWQANTLEWQNDSNLTVCRWAYDYSIPGISHDYFPQNFSGEKFNFVLAVQTEKKQ